MTGYLIGVYGVALTAALLMAGTAMAAGNTYAAACRNPRSGALEQCGAPNLPSYQRWQDGTPAVGSTAGYGSSSEGEPHYFHGYNALYGFGR
ncbi:MAG: hypothetical protein JO001_14145 [Alphaproteobacteria bacterium]|nr:hypothetical protein [Alphaproteobacteria bacterium]